MILGNIEKWRSIIKENDLEDFTKLNFKNKYQYKKEDIEEDDEDEDDEDEDDDDEGDYYTLEIY